MTAGASLCRGDQAGGGHPELVSLLGRNPEKQKLTQQKESGKSSRVALIVAVVWCAVIATLSYRSTTLQTIAFVPFLGQGEATRLATNQEMTTMAQYVDGDYIVEGLKDIASPTENPQGTLQWYCAPDSGDTTTPASSREGKGGSWQWNNDTGSLTLYPPAKKDYWRKTYYEPQIIKDDGPFLYYAPGLDTNQFYSVTTTFDLVAHEQFDQAGIMLRLDLQHWLKAGIEVVDGRPRLSCVVTNGYSDWSTQFWPHYQTLVNDTAVLVPTVHLRVHWRNASVVVEAQLENTTTQWDFLRIAHLDVVDATQVLQAGIFACSPADQRGGHAVFTQFGIQQGSHVEHNADGN